MNHHPDFDDMSLEQQHARRQANRLRQQSLRHPDPRDPDALDEADRARLKDLEEWTP